MKARMYQECTYCVMDTSDPLIAFDSDGRCNHCRNFETLLGTAWFPTPEGAKRLDAKLDDIRRKGEGKDFDCIIGLSGGVDSSYLALLAQDWGLRPLVVHVDAGWNSELAVQNIERIVRHTGWDLHTHVVNWNTMRELQLAYLRAGVANQDVPQDHVFFAALYRFATKHRVKYVMNGFNIATEAIFPHSWQGPAMDAKNLKAINKRFGTGGLRDYPTVGMFRYYFWYPVVRGMTPVHPLNYMPYSKASAIRRLQSEIGWRSYERKHGESLFTKFFQNHYLPTRFGYDKRRPHLSSLIASGQVTRSDALIELAMPLYDAQELIRDKEYLCRKLRISDEELTGLMNVPVHDHTDFANWGRAYETLKAAQLRLRSLTGRRMSIYE